MPPGARAGAAIAFEVRALFCCGEFCGFGGVDADIEHVEISADARFHFLKALDHPIENHAAKHGAFIIAEDEDDWFAMEAGRERDRGSVFIHEWEVERN